MIADYEESATPLHQGGRQYALGQTHKHLPEMAKICELASSPCFSPIVVPHYSGMEVTVPLHNLDIEKAKECYREYYADGLVNFVEDGSEAGFLSSARLSGRDSMEVSVYGNSERAILVSRFDNLGKGASGAAIQNLNIVLVAVFGYLLVQIINYQRAQEYRESLTDGMAYIISEGVARQPNLQQKMDWISDASDLLELPIHYVDASKVDITRAEARRIADRSR